MKYIFLLAFSFISTFAFSQKDSIHAVDENEGIFVLVEEEARYAGDWKEFLTTNLNPNVPIKKGAKPGKYTVIVQFIVDKEGKVSSITALTNHGYGMEEEVIRVLKKAKTWKPAMQNGRVVKAWKKQPVTFVISEK